MTDSLLLAFARFLLIVPFLLAGLFVSRENNRYLFHFMALFILDIVILENLMDVKLFEGQTWNWVGKAGELAMAFIYIYTFRSLTNKEMGLKLRVENAVPLFTIIFLLLAGHLLWCYHNYGFSGDVGMELFFFEFIPGITEEIIYRGIFLGLLNRVYLGRVQIWGAPVGWGLIVTSVAFGSVHAIGFTEEVGWQFNLWYFCGSFLMGLLCGFIKEKSRSLLPGILFHNLYNIIIIYF